MFKIRSILGSEEANLSKKIKELQKRIDISENIKEKDKLNKSPLEFYDIIIAIDSIKNVQKKGWEVLMNNKGKEFEESNEKGKHLVIGVLGNRNKGKSFLLQCLSEEDLQTGTSISTIGLSIKITKENYILLDSAGFESPLLRSNEKILDISRDKLFTEAFLQNYIMTYSNVLLLVVGLLTFSEQKLVNRITKDLKNLKKEKKNKYLIVIHNLQTLETKEQVENYINETLLNSATFKLEKGVSNFNGKNNEYYFDSENESIRHFIFARENSEAGDFYNCRTIELIKNMNEICTNKYEFSYKDTIKNHFKSMGKDIIDLKTDTELELKQQDNVEIEENENVNFKNLIAQKNIFKYEGKNEIILKKFIIDELGSSSFINNGFNPEYECYHNKKELVVKIDCTGEDIKLKARRIKNQQEDGPDFFIEVKGERKNSKIEDKDIEYIKERESGIYYLLIPFNNKKYIIGKCKTEDIVNGIQTFRFPLETIDDDDDAEEEEKNNQSIK